MKTTNVWVVSEALFTRRIAKAEKVQARLSTAVEMTVIEVATSFGSGHRLQRDVADSLAFAYLRDLVAHARLQGIVHGVGDGNKISINPKEPLLVLPNTCDPRFPNLERDYRFKFIPAAAERLSEERS